MNQFIERLKELMLVNELNATQLAANVNCDHKAVERWLKGLYFPRLNSLIKVCSYFGCSIDFILARTDRHENWTPANLEIIFSKRLAFLMKKYALSATRLSKETKIHLPNISRWLKGHNPDISALITLSEYFGCEIEFLLGRADTE